MKIIAVIPDSYKTKYIAEVSHEELCNYLDLYSYDTKTLKVDTEVDLGDGYTHWRKTEQALKKTQEFFNANIDNIKAITNAFTTLARKPNEKE